MTAGTATDPSALEHRNEIVLVGRITSPPVERELPSGDVVRSWRLTVDRVDGSGRFDVVDCTAWTPRLRRTSSAWGKGDVVEVTGALRRRFWRAGASVASICDVEVLRARRILAAEPAAKRRRTPG